MAHVPLAGAMGVQIDDVPVSVPETVNVILVDPVIAPGETLVSAPEGAKVSDDAPASAPEPVRVPRGVKMRLDAPMSAPAPVSVAEGANASVDDPTSAPLPVSVPDGAKVRVVEPDIAPEATDGLNVNARAGM